MIARRIGLVALLVAVCTGQTPTTSPPPITFPTPKTTQATAPPPVDPPQTQPPVQPTKPTTQAPPTEPPPTTQAPVTNPPAKPTTTVKQSNPGQSVAPTTQPVQPNDTTPPPNDQPTTSPPAGTATTTAPESNTPTDSSPIDDGINSTAKSSVNSTMKATPAPTTSAPPSVSGSEPSTPVILGVSAAGVFVIAAIGYYTIRRRKAKQMTGMTSTTGVLLSMNSTTSEMALDWKQLEDIRVGLDEIFMTKSIAAGAFGEIWLGEFRGETVAIKTCLSTKASRKYLQNFIDELALMATLNSPFVVRLIGVAWFRPADLKAVMEFMNLGDLKNFLDDTNSATFPWENKMECALGIAEALVHLKSKQIIHRDLKSRNVLLDSDKGTKLADFGISREDSLSTLTAGAGTYRWMAPEVLTFKYYTIAVDVFSFGVLLSELDTHQIPYTDLRNDEGHAISDTAIVGMVLYNNLRPTFQPSCPSWIFKLAMRCMNSVAVDRPEPEEIVQEIKNRLLSKTVNEA